MATPYLYSEREISYAAHVLAAGQFLSCSIERSRYGDRRITGICGHDPRRDREWLLSLIENRRPPNT